MLRLDADEKVSAIVPVREFVEGQYVVMVTKRGYVKRVDLMAFSNIRAGGIRATSLDEDDELIDVHQSDGTRDCVVSTKSGMAIRFHESEVRAMGRTARGVKAITLGNEDKVVSFSMMPAEIDEKQEMALFTVCENGYGKRTLISEYRTQGRGGKGIIDIKTEGRNGPVIETCRVSKNDEVMLMTTTGKVIRTPVANISLIGRNTMGVRLINLEEGETVGAMAKLVDPQTEPDEEQGAEGLEPDEQAEN
jgi:DNA gyrase subunit A